MQIKKVHKILAGVVIVAAIIFIANGISGNVRRQAALDKAFEKILMAETYHVKADLDMNMVLTPQDVDRSFTNAFISVEGDVRYNEEDIPELKGTLYMESKGRGNILFVDGDARILADQVAFRLDNLPTLMNNSASLVNKWTYVDAPVLTTKNKEAVIGSFREVLENMEYLGKERIEGKEAHRFSGTVSSEQKQRLIESARKDASGNSALHVLARLLKHNDVHSFDIWVDKDKRELALIRTRFVRPLNDGSEAEFATLNLSFTQYGKKVDMDRPEKQLTVRPDVFSRLFGEGEMELQAAN